MGMLVLARIARTCRGSPLPRGHAVCRLREPRSVVTADVDGDGRLDVVTANAGAGSVSVLRGAGDGTLGPATSIAIGGSPTTVSVGDFNHDNDPDLAVTVLAAAPAPPAVTVLLGSVGASFNPPATYALEQDALGGAVADLDADGNPDIVAVDPFGVSVLSGTANGSFGAAVRQPVGTFRPAFPSVTSTGTTTPTSCSVSSWTSCWCCPAAPVPPSAPSTAVTAVTPNSAAISVGRDGHLDLAVADFSAPAVAVVLGVGDGTFAPAVSYGTGVVNGMATHVAVARLDGDTRPTSS